MKNIVSIILCSFIALHVFAKNSNLNAKCTVQQTSASGSVKYVSSRLVPITTDYLGEKMFSVVVKGVQFKYQIETSTTEPLPGKERAFTTLLTSRSADGTKAEAIGLDKLSLTVRLEDESRITLSCSVIK